MTHGGYEVLLQNELQALSQEAKRKFHSVKQVNQCVFLKVG
jgi:hypothetical protein